MADLIEKFFQEDLTEAEEKALGDELFSSEETALRLGERAEQAYMRLGLPEPVWPALNGTIPHVSKAVPWIRVFFWTILAGMIGITAWWCFFHKNATPAPSASLTRPASVEIPRILSRGEPSETASEAVAPSLKRPADKNPIPAVSKEKPVQATGELGARKPASKAKQPLPAEPPAASTSFNAYPPPLNLDENPGQSYSNLSVVVRRSTPGSLTVRVLNAQDAEVILLFHGDLEAGNWVFEWNGRLVDGRMAGPGDYQIEVQSGSFTQKKAIQIK
jgi:hypothetical protein